MQANKVFYDGKERETFYVEGFFIDVQKGNGKHGKYLAVFTEKGVIDTRIPLEWLKTVMQETSAGFPSMSCRPQEIIQREEWNNA